MTIQYTPPKRYIVDTKTNDMLTTMRLARIEPVREFTSESFIGDESPFNPYLNADVKYNTNTNTIPRRTTPPPKLNNNYPAGGNIALFDPRIGNADVHPIVGKHLQSKQLEDNARSRIQLLNNNKHYDANNGAFVGNGFIYNPNLPESATNVRPYNYSTHVIDERFTYHTNDRQYNEERDRVKIAHDLRNSKDLQERNRRQKEADDALNHRSYHDRVKDLHNNEVRIDNNKALYSFTKEDIKRASAQNERNALTEYKKAKEAFTPPRSEGINDPEFEQSGVDMHFDELDSKGIRVRASDQREHWYDNDTAIEKQSGNLIERFADFISDVVTGAFTWNKKSINVESKNANQKRVTMSKNLYDEDGSRIDDVLNTTFNVDDKTFTNQKPQYNREEHMLVIKNGNTMDAYPDEDHSYTAVSFINEDADYGIKRHIVFVENGKFIIAQKLHADAIFNGERMGDEHVLIMELPVEAVDAKVRERIQKLNLGSKRDKVLELTYDDFVLFTQYLVQYPNLQERIKDEQLHFRVRGNTYDEDIVTNFEGRKTFTDNSVYNNLAENAREHLIQHWKGRVEKDLPQEGVESFNSPFKDVNYKLSSKPGGMLSLPRNVGVKRGQFD